jgi:hypothetical protein
MIALEDNETELFRKYDLGGAAYHVILHKESCTSMRRELLHSDPGKSRSIVANSSQLILIYDIQFWIRRTSQSVDADSSWFHNGSDNACSQTWMSTKGTRRWFHCM